MDEFYSAIRSLPEWLRRPLAQLPEQTACRIHELRLRAGCGLMVTLPGECCAAASLAGCPPELVHLRLTQQQIEELFYTLCDGSVHTHQSEIAEGYLTTPDGCRVGIAGRYLLRENGETSLQQPEALNLRIARSVEVCLPEELHAVLRSRFAGLLVAGEPDSGKTTVLRQIAKALAARSKKVAVIDERAELFPERLPGNVAVDRLSGLPKAKSIQMALRTLSPQVILLDELGGMEDVLALEQGFFSGVDLIASIHASSAEEALRRPQVQRLRQCGMLRALAVLAGSSAPGRIKEVVML